jgi:lipopolysaccharide export system permease protein
VIDRYVVNRVLLTVAFSLAVFLVIYVLIDLIDHLDDFMTRGIPPHDILRYYAHYAPYIIVLTLPVGMLLAVLFVIGDMGSGNELVAIRAAGISIYRIAFPLLRVGLLVSLVALLLTEFAVPRGNEVRSEILQLAPEGNLSGQLYHVCRQDRSGYIVYAEQYDAASKCARRVAIVLMKASKPLRRIDADEMVWDDMGWMLRNAIDRTFAGEETRFAEYTTRRMPMLSLRPEDLARVEKLPEQMSFFELSDHIRRTRAVGGDASKWLVDLHMKVAFPLANLLMVWIGFPLAARSWRGGKAIYVGLTLLVGFLFFVAVRVAQAMGRSGELDPIVAAWGPNLLFFLVGALLFHWTRK